MYCGNCGTKNQEGASFCSNCGTKINVPEPVKEEVKPVEQPVQPVVVEQPVQSVQPTAPVQPTQPQKSGMPIWQVLVIIGLLFFVLLLLIVVVVIIIVRKPSDGKKGKVSEGYKDNTTILVYLDGSNLESNNKIATSELDSIRPETIDLEHINVLVYTGGTSRWHNYIKNTENAIYKLTPEGFEKVETYAKTNMGDASTLQSFLDYAYTNYTDSNFELILWDHGGGLDGAIYDDFTGDNISLDDFSKALKNSKFNENNKLDNIMFRTCLNGTLEVANTLSDYTRYVVFSEEITNGATNHNVLGYFINDLSTDIHGAELGKRFIMAYQQQMYDIDVYGQAPVTYSVVDTSKMKDFVNKFENFISTVDLNNNYSEISRVRSGLYQYGYTMYEYSEYDTVDFKQLITELKPYASGNADEVLQAFDQVVVYNHTNLDKSNGLSIYFPYRGGNNAVTLFLGVYNKLPLTNYNSFIKQFYNKKSGASSYGFNFSKESMKSENNETVLTLNDEQKDKIVKAGYYIFRQEQEKGQEDYYQIVYSSNNAIVENGVVKTNNNGRLLKVKDIEDGSSQYIALSETIRDGVTRRTTTGILVDTDEDVMTGNRRVVGNVHIEEKDGKPVFGNLEMVSRDERVEGVLFDINKYEKIELMRTSPKLKDAKGNLNKPADWTYPKTRYGISFELDKAELEYTTYDDGNFYVLFFLYDINNNGYMSDLVKVGE